MLVFVCTDHDYHWPIGVASVVKAESEVAARALLDAQLVEHGLRLVPYTLKQLPDGPVAVVLCDGEY